MSWPRQGSQNPLDNRECEWKTWISWVWGFEGVHAVKGSFEVALPPNASLEEVELESTSERTSPVGKPVLHMHPMHTGEPVARSPDALARPASNNLPLSEHDTQELRRLLYLKAEGLERQEWLQYLRQTWKSSIWSEEDDDSYTLPDPEIRLEHSLHYGQQCSPEWDDGSVPAETADRQKKKEHGKSNLHAEEDFLQKIETLNLDSRLKKLLLTYEEVFGALPPPLSCKKNGPDGPETET